MKQNTKLCLKCLFYVLYSNFNFLSRFFKLILRFLTAIAFKIYLNCPKPRLTLTPRHHAWILIALRCWNCSNSYSCFLRSLSLKYSFISDVCLKYYNTRVKDRSSNTEYRFVRNASTYQSLKISQLRWLTIALIFQNFKLIFPTIYILKSFFPVGH